MYFLDLLQALRNENCNVDEAIRRFRGRPEMYLSLVSGFIQDETLDDYLSAFREQDYDSAYRHIHSLKGIASSFGFTSLYDLTFRITEAIHEKKYNYATEHNPELIENYKKIAAVIQQYA